MYNTGSRFRFEFAQKYGILLRVLLDKEKFKDCATKYINNLNFPHQYCLKNLIIP